MGVRTCRAGSETAFSCGPTIGTSQANYDGNFPYAGGAKGEYRKKTVPVKSFAPNDWGLYEMHGNVWEWCADGLRDYHDEMHEDPRGSKGEFAPRVVRGGSWSGVAGGLRSASRFAWPRDERYEFVGFLGFRFALRSTHQEQEAGAERPHFILLDEPLAGIDPIAVNDIRELIGQLRNRNIGVLITDHNVRDTLGIVDRAYILHDGTVLTEGKPDDIVNNDDVRKVYLGESFKL